MKLTIAIIGILMAAGLGWCGPLSPDPATFSGGGSAARAQAEASEQAYQAAFNQKQAFKAAQQAEISKIYSADVWRVIKGTTNFAGGRGWSEIQGEMLRRTEDGIIFEGAWGPILTIQVAIATEYDVHGQTLFVPDYSGPDGMKHKFLVKNLPPECLEQDVQSNRVVVEKMAFYAGNRTNNSGVIPIFDYGTPCAKIWSAAELAAIKARQDAPKNAALAYDEKMAAKGDAYGLLRMGERSRDHDGVAQNLALARTYFQRAKDAGSPTAAEELLKLDALTAK